MQSYINSYRTDRIVKCKIFVYVIFFIDCNSIIIRMSKKLFCFNFSLFIAWNQKLFMQNFTALANPFLKLIWFLNWKMSFGHQFLTLVEIKHQIFSKQKKKHSIFVDKPYLIIKFCWPYYFGHNNSQ